MPHILDTWAAVGSLGLLGAMSMAMPGTAAALTGLAEIVGWCGVGGDLALPPGLHWAMS